MKRHQIVLISIILMGLINIHTQCKRNDYTAPDYKYSFKEKISISPYQLNYHVGDTVWFQLYVPGKKFNDTKTNTTVFFDSASINFDISCNLVFNNPYIGDGPFASFVFPQDVSAYTTNYSGTTQAFLSSGCSHSADYLIKVGVVLIQKGVFSVGVFTNGIQNCFNGYATNAQLSFSLDVDDTHKSFYEQLPFSDIAKTPDQNVESNLDSKIACIINVM